MKDEQRLMSEFHVAIRALEEAQAAERLLFDAIGEMDPADVPSTLSKAWYDLNKVTKAAREQVDRTVRALSGGG